MIWVLFSYFWLPPHFSFLICRQHSNPALAELNYMEYPGTLWNKDDRELFKTREMGPRAARDIGGEIGEMAKPGSQ